MATADAHLDGLGPPGLAPTLGRAARSLPLSPQEGFVLSRVDGRTTLGQILALVPFERAVTIATLRRLWLAGALDLPGVERPRGVVPAAASSPSVPVVPAAAPTPIAPSAPPSPPHPSGLPEEYRRRIDSVFFALEDLDAHALLELPRGADSKEIKRAYFRLSKEFHPDRHFGKNLGEYHDRLSKIFQAVKSAFEELTGKGRAESAGSK